MQKFEVSIAEWLFGSFGLEHEIQRTWSNKTCRITWNTVVSIGMTTSCFRFSSLVISLPSTNCTLLTRIPNMSRYEIKTLTWLWYSIPMLRVLIKIANKIPCWKYLCSTSFLIDRLMHRIAQTQRLPQVLNTLLAREVFAHLSPSSGHWSVPWSSQQHEQLSMSDANHCVRSSRVMRRSVIPKINVSLYTYARSSNGIPRSLLISIARGIFPLICSLS